MATILHEHVRSHASHIVLQGYAPHSGTEADTVNYSLLLQDIRTALDDLGQQTGRFYGLTAALPCGPELINNIQIDVVSDILTELNLMTYDFHG